MSLYIQSTLLREGTSRHTTALGIVAVISVYWKIFSFFLLIRMVLDNGGKVFLLPE